MGRIDLFYNQFILNRINYENVLNYKPVNRYTYVLNHCGTTLKDFNFQDDFETSKSILFQLSYLIIIFHKVYYVQHGDIHSKNIMIKKKEKKEYYYYVINNICFKLFTDVEVSLVILIKIGFFNRL